MTNTRECCQRVTLRLVGGIRISRNSAEVSVNVALIAFVSTAITVLLSLLLVGYSIATMMCYCRVNQSCALQIQLGCNTHHPQLWREPYWLYLGYWIRLLNETWWDFPLNKHA